MQTNYKLRIAGSVVATILLAVVLFFVFFNSIRLLKITYEFARIIWAGLGMSLAFLVAKLLGVKNAWIYSILYLLIFLGIIFLFSWGLSGAII